MKRTRFEVETEDGRIEYLQGPDAEAWLSWVDGVLGTAQARGSAPKAPDVDWLRAEGSQVARLAKFILDHVMDEPSRSEGAVDCAIRIICRLQRESAFLNSCALGGEIPTADGLKSAGDIGDVDARSWTKELRCGP